MQKVGFSSIIIAFCNETIIPPIYYISYIFCYRKRYTIPKGTIVVASIWHNHFDPAVWKEPRKFCPERFLDKDGKFRNREEFIPFGIGKCRSMGVHSRGLTHNFEKFVCILENPVLHSFVPRQPSVRGRFYFVCAYFRPWCTVCISRDYETI